MRCWPTRRPPGRRRVAQSDDQGCDRARVAGRVVACGIGAPPAYPEFVLTDAERAQLRRWADGDGAARLAVRAKIVLACAEPGVVYERLAADLGVTTMTVGA
jgi:hypothetical protein